MCGKEKRNRGTTGDRCQSFCCRCRGFARPRRTPSRPRRREERRNVTRFSFFLAPSLSLFLPLVFLVDQRWTHAADITSTRLDHESIAFVPLASSTRKTRRPRTAVKWIQTRWSDTVSGRIAPCERARCDSFCIIFFFFPRPPLPLEIADICPLHLWRKNEDEKESRPLSNKTFIESSSFFISPRRFNSLDRLDSRAWKLIPSDFLRTFLSRDNVPFVFSFNTAESAANWLVGLCSAMKNNSGEAKGHDPDYLSWQLHGVISDMSYNLPTHNILSVFMRASHHYQFFY